MLSQLFELGIEVHASIIQLMQHSEFDGPERVDDLGLGRCPRRSQRSASVSYCPPEAADVLHEVHERVVILRVEHGFLVGIPSMEKFFELAERSHVELGLH